MLDANSTTAVEHGIALNAGVAASAVTAQLPVGRRLATASRSLQQGTVTVATTMEVVDATAVQSRLSAFVGSGGFLSMAIMASSSNNALQSPGMTSP